tara:strand:- start:60 stop:1880 length:1821 start_codon:yes stop_codon:yes gene_type:complete
MAGFWTSEDKIPIGQTSISVPAEHGLDYDPGQKIEFQIPSSINFFQPKESYLKFDVELSNPSNPCFLQLDGQLGGQVLIKDIRIYSGGAGRILLEEFQNYNVLTAVKYDYEINDSEKQKRALTEGCVYYNEVSRSTTGLIQDTANNVSGNPYFKEPGVTGLAPEFKKCRCLLPLNTGIFSNDKIFPVGLTEGLIVEIILESASKCIRPLDTVLKNRKLMGNPVFLSAGASVAGGAAVGIPADPNLNPVYPPLAATPGTDGFTEFFIRRDNSQGINDDVGGSLFPFAIGQKISFMNINTMVEVTSTTAGAGGAGTIASLAYDNGAARNTVKVTLEGIFSPSVNMTVDTVLIDKSISNATEAGWKPTYKITDCEFVVQQVTMPQGYTAKLSSMMKEGGAMNYDFLSFTNYKTSQIASELVTTLNIPLVQQRAKAILAVPVDAGNYSQRDSMSGEGTEIEYYDRQDKTARGQNRSLRSGLVGISDQLTQYQLFYDGRLNPSRKVVCSRISSKTSIDQQPLIELEKALVMAGVKPHSMLNFQKNFLIGRALSLQDGVYDARGRDFQLQLEYQETDAAGAAVVPAHNKLWNVYCAHLRRIVISGNAISMEV